MEPNNKAYEALKAIIIQRDGGILSVQYIAPSSTPPTSLSIVGPGWVELRRGKLARRVFEYSSDVDVTSYPREGLVQIRVGELQTTVRLTVGGKVVLIEDPVVSASHLRLLHLQEVMGLLALTEKLKVPLFFGGLAVGYRPISRTFSSMDGGFFSEIPSSDTNALHAIELTPPGTTYLLDVTGTDENSSVRQIQLFRVGNVNQSISIPEIDMKDVYDLAKAGEELSSTSWWLLNKVKTHFNKKDTKTSE